MDNKTLQQEAEKRFPRFHPYAEYENELQAARREGWIAHAKEKEEWISVASAPKDGTEIIGWDDRTESRYIVWWNPYMANGVWYTHGNYLPSISKWQPLPALPSQPSASTKCNCKDTYDSDKFEGGYPACPIHDKPSAKEKEPKTQQP